MGAANSVGARFARHEQARPPSPHAVTTPALSGARPYVQQVNLGYPTHLVGTVWLVLLHPHLVTSPHPRRRILLTLWSNGIILVYWPKANSLGRLVP